MRPPKLCWQSVTKHTRTSNATIDAPASVTLWNFDRYGRMIRKTDANTVLVETNGYDAGGRLAKHWTPAKGLTVTDLIGVIKLAEVGS